MKIKLETLVFNLHLWHFGVHSLLPSVYPSVVRPVILQPEEPAPDPVIGLPSPGALENPLGISRTLSSVAVTGESGPGSSPNTSGASSSDIRYGHSSGASSTSIGCCRTLSMVEANSDSDRAYQPSLMFVISWIIPSGFLFFRGLSIDMGEPGRHTVGFRWMPSLRLSR